MSVVHVKRDLSCDDIEALLSSVSSLDDIEDDKVVRIPNSLKFGGGFGVEASLIQVLATWARVCQEKCTLHTYISDAHKSADLCGSLYGLSAIVLADKVLLDQKDYISKVEVLQPAIDYIDNISKLDFKRAARGMGFHIPCLKSGRSSGKIPPLYSDEVIVGHVQFEKVISSAIDVVAPQRSASRLFSAEVVSKISQAIRQLIMNATDHAQHDHNGNEYARGAWGLILRSQEYSFDECSGFTSRGRKLHSYLYDMCGSTDDRTRFLEISVVDSGPGFSGRWLGKDASKGDYSSEMDSILKCFQKHVSTKRDRSAGNGLTMVLDVLSELSGWMSVRTGRTLIEKGFSQVGIAGPNEITMQDVSEMPAFAYGVAFTIVIPVPKSKQYA